VRATGAPEEDGDLAFDVDVALEAAADALAALEGAAVAPVIPLARG
jgi:hypothetical protein